MPTDALPTLLAAWAAFVAAAISPGPNRVALASRALGAGRGPRRSPWRRGSPRARFARAFERPSSYGMD